MGSEAPCCGGGLSGIYLLIIHSIFSILTTVPPSPIFSKFPMFFQHYPPCLIFKHSKNHRKILQRLLNQGLQNGKYFFDWRKLGLIFKKKGGHIRKTMPLTILFRVFKAFLNHPTWGTKWRELMTRLVSRPLQKWRRKPFKYYRRTPKASSC